jgi:Fe-Mn family superoxide dismutase
MEQLKSTVSAAAMGLSASGWIWLACDDKGDLGVVPTFGPGTLLVRSRALQMPTDTFLVVGEGTDRTRPATRQQKWPQPSISPASGLAPSSESPMPDNPTTPQTRRIHTSSRLSFLSRPSGLHSSVVDNKDLRSRENLINFGRLGVTLFPLFCISVHEHAWLTAGYGIWGKEEYLRQFWTVLDWKKVSDAFQKFAINLDSPRYYTME